MEAIILAGGMGTRLKGVVDDLPKPMAPVGGKPFLEYLVLMLASQGLRKIVLSVGYRKSAVRSYFGNGSFLGVDIFYSEEDTPLGTGGAVREALKTAGSPHCLILNGDTFSRLDFQEMEKFHVSNNCLATVGLMRKKNAGRYGSVEIGRHFEITGFYEKNKPGAGYVNCGAYIMDRSMIERMPAGRFSLENDLLPDLAGSGIFGFVSSGFFIDIGTPSSYRYINDHFDVFRESFQEIPSPHHRGRRETGRGMNTGNIVKEWNG